MVSSHSAERNTQKEKDRKGQQQQKKIKQYSFINYAEGKWF